MLINSRKESYAKIGEKVGMERSGVYRSLTFPWRTSIETYLKLAKVIGYNQDEAIKEWKGSNLAMAKKLLCLDDGVYEKSFRDIKPQNITFGDLANSTGLSKSTVESICYTPELCSWKAVCKVLDTLKLNKDDYYNPWKYLVYLQKEKIIDESIRACQNSRA